MALNTDLTTHINFINFTKICLKIENTYTISLFRIGFSDSHLVTTQHEC